MSAASTAITVSELNRRARLAIEKSLPSCWVTGEISNLTRASSGHWYFTLKDEQSSVKCAFFRNRSQFVDWQPSGGDKVEVRAQATLYEPRGDYQLIVDVMRRAGQGALFEEFLRLKAKLEAEGLFQADRKLKPPQYPQCIGVVTSLQAAALQDVLTTLEKRWPVSAVIIYSTAVQGADAAESIRQALNTAISRDECDVLLLVRGGGSLEDLHAYNNEALARTISSANIPIIAGIGHETDFSIADFVAAVRAATPTAAAQSATPDKLEMQGQIFALQTRLEKSGKSVMYRLMQRLDSLTRRVLHPGHAIAQNQQQVAQLCRRLAINNRNQTRDLKQRLQNTMTRLTGQSPTFDAQKSTLQRHATTLRTALSIFLDRHKNRIQQSFNSLQQLNPENILSRGYCLAQTEDGKIIRTTESVLPASKLRIRLMDGQLITTVEQVIPNIGRRFPF